MPRHSVQVLEKQLVTLGEKAKDKHVKELKRVTERPCTAIDIISACQQEGHYADEQEPLCLECGEDGYGGAGDEEARQVPKLRRASTDGIMSVNHVRQSCQWEQQCAFHGEARGERRTLFSKRS
jgi:hypothetical protein